MGGRPTWSGAARARRPVRARDPGAAGIPAEPSGRPRRLRGRTPPSSPSAVGDGAHLVGHSYGGVITLLAAAAVPDAIALADRDRAAGDGRRPGQSRRRRVRRRAGSSGGRRPDATTRRRSCAASYLRRLRLRPPSPLPPQLEQGARTLIVERSPWEARDRSDALAAAAVPEARRLGRPPRRVRRRLRRARRAARRRAARAAGLRPHGAAASRRSTSALAEFVTRARTPRREAEAVSGLRLAR